MCDFEDPLPDYARFEDEAREGPFLNARHLAYHLRQGAAANTDPEWAEAAKSAMYMATSLEVLSERVRQLLIDGHELGDHLAQGLDVVTEAFLAKNPLGAVALFAIDMSTAEALGLPMVADTAHTTQ